MWDIPVVFQYYNYRGIKYLEYSITQLSITWFNEMCFQPYIIYSGEIFLLVQLEPSSVVLDYILDILFLYNCSAITSDILVIFICFVFMYCFISGLKSPQHSIHSWSFNRRNDNVWMTVISSLLSSKQTSYLLYLVQYCRKSGLLFGVFKRNSLADSGMNKQQS
jgi:hypothetical protein